MIRARLFSNQLSNDFHGTQRMDCVTRRLPVATPAIISHNPNSTMSRIARITILLLWLVLGLALILVPWSDIWETNYFILPVSGAGDFSEERRICAGRFPGWDS